MLMSVQLIKNCAWQGGAAAFANNMAFLQQRLSQLLQDSFTNLRREQKEVALCTWQRAMQQMRPLIPAWTVTLSQDSSPACWQP